MEVKAPPTTMLAPSGESASALTRPPAATGFQGRSAALEALTAASLSRVTEPTALNSPPRYTVVDVATIERTDADMRGRKLVMRAPVAGFRATARHTVEPL